MQSMGDPRRCNREGLPESPGPIQYDHAPGLILRIGPAFRDICEGIDLVGHVVPFNLRRQRFGRIGMNQLLLGDLAFNKCSFYRSGGACGCVLQALEKAQLRLGGYRPGAEIVSIYLHRLLYGRCLHHAED